MKKADESKLRTSLIRAMTDWWDREDGLEATGLRARMPLIGDATLVYMAEQALGVLLAIDDVQTRRGLSAPAAPATRASCATTTRGALRPRCVRSAVTR